MKNKLATPIHLIFSVASLLGFSTCAIAQDSQKIATTLSVGYFSEDFHWSIAGTSQGTDPNIYSELRWTKLRGPQTYFDIEYNLWKGFLLKGNVSWTPLTNGGVTDTDFGQDNRTDTLYHESFDADKGFILSSDLSLGYKFSVTDKFSFSPFIGYGINSQSLYILGDPGNGTGDLKSTYGTQWQGLTVGFNLKVALTKNLSVIPQLVYHQMNYKAKANWNLIEDFQHPVSFRHKAKGYGIEPSLQINYAITERVALLVQGKISRWSTGKGVDTLYRTNGDVSNTQLNSIYRRNYGFAIGVSYSF